MGVLTRVPGLAAGALPGVALGVAALVAGLARRDKALHPIGRQGTGDLTVTDPVPGLGVDPLARVGTHPCTLRWSRSMGLPEGWPDIEGMALRLPTGGPDGGVADVLLASTGTHGPSRYLLLLRGPGRFGHQTSLLPVRTPAGPATFMIAPDAEPVDGSPPAAYTLHVALGAGDWVRVGRIEITWSEQDTSQRFDPVANPLAGTEQYPFVQALREPPYVAARLVTSVGRAGRQRRAAARRAGRRGPAVSQ
ncbi:MAG: phosphodiesterase [Nocardioides sp.]|jgi:hypothetical protein|uniref:hypothetical protein n=1 Tax=Nocardioides sp. TaxID=35761 RepID=UPI0026191B53|nr:hypothetical protein [Nocardioides sp.]MCW2834349.1 phosphodiesterase [Nocardioides sp.]